MFVTNLHERYAGVELGGTKVICVVGKSLDSIEHQVRIPTSDPETTLSSVLEFLKSCGPISRLGVGSFGPIDLDVQSASFGSILKTPKEGWQGASLYSLFREKLACPVNIDTDVNAAALAEYHLGAARDLDNFIYVTVGTGIGGGAFIRGKPVLGLGHPEMGHSFVNRLDVDKDFKSVCPFHDNCIEGLASGTAISARWGNSLSNFDSSHPSWDLEARYLAEFFANLTVLYSPKKIIVGGGVSSEQLLSRVRVELLKKLNGYVSAISEKESLSDYLCMPELGGDAGPYGSFLLAKNK
jgi:fructokinase